MVEGPIVIHAVYDPFLFHQPLGLILEKTKIEGIHFCYATIWIFLVHYILFGMYKIMNTSLIALGLSFLYFWGGLCA